MYATKPCLSINNMCITASEYKHNHHGSGNPRGASSMAIEIFSQASHKFKHYLVSRLRPPCLYICKSEQRRKVIKRVGVFLKKIQNPKPLI